MAKRIEYALWGTRNGNDDIIRVNGKETFTNAKSVLKMKQILEGRKEFKKVRIQKMDMSNTNLRNEWSGLLKGGRRT